MTHRLVDQTLIEDFTRWPMDVVFNETKDYQWVHIWAKSFVSDVISEN